MKRKSCILWKKHGTNFVAKCKFNLECTDSCEDYSRTKADFVRRQRDHKAYLKAIDTPPSIENAKRPTLIIGHESSWPCPECGNNNTYFIVRLRDGFYECQKCGDTFIRDEATDDFDLDGLNERERTTNVRKKKEVIDDEE